MASLRKFIVGNWKMNGLRSSMPEIINIANAAAELPTIDSAICPPSTLITAAATAAPEFQIGGQDCHHEKKGAFTGTISAEMLANAGASLTIVGHSERRIGCGETSELIRSKATAALSQGLNVILCVGETNETRQKGDAEAFVLSQLNESLPDLVEGRELVIAYEPVWAIGTGLTPTTDDVRAMHLAIRNLLIERYGPDGETIRILYGGSVTGDNANELLSIVNVDGALVGGASLTAEKFIPIMKAAADLQA